MAISTFGATLKWGATALTVTKTIDIKDFPDLGGKPQMIETTTLSDAMQTYILGILSSGEMPFKANYTKADFQLVQTDANTPMFYSLDLGVAGVEGIFEWEGSHAVSVLGAGVNTGVEMQITIAPSTKPTLKAA